MGESFRVYVEHVLVRRWLKATIVVMDNLGSHKGKAIRRAIRAPGRGYSSCRLQSDLNPMSRCSQAEAFPAKSRERNRPATWRRIGTSSRLQSRECANYFVNSGYASV